jgi:hypothetical protein
MHVSLLLPSFLTCVENFQHLVGNEILYCCLESMHSEGYAEIWSLAMSNAVTIFSLPHDAFVFFIQICAWRIGDLKPENFLVGQPGPRTMASWLACSPACACIVSMMCGAPSSFSGQHRTLGQRRVLHAGEGASAIVMRWR